MGRCCDGRNAYTPISRTRYFAGLIIFYIFHFQCKTLLLLRHIFIKKYPHYNALSRFHEEYFKNTLKELLEKKGLKIKTNATSKNQCPKP